MPRWRWITATQEHYFFLLLLLLLFKRCYDVDPALSFRALLIPAGHFQGVYGGRQRQLGGD
jgi:hypothetical protein